MVGEDDLSIREMPRRILVLHGLHEAQLRDWPILDGSDHAQEHVGGGGGGVVVVGGGEPPVVAGETYVLVAVVVGLGFGPEMKEDSLAFLGHGGGIVGVVDWRGAKAL